MTEHETLARPLGITGRRGFVTFASLSILSLYGLWSLYGAAPGLGLGHGGDHDDVDHGGAGGHEHGGEGSGHAGHGVAGADTEAFRTEAEAYIQRYTLPDGSFQPPTSAASAAPMADMPMAEMDLGGMDMGNMSTGEHAGHSGHDAMSMAPAPASGEPAPVDVYLLVQQWMFEPAVIRLTAGVPYRFRMLALDVSHGASFQLGFGSRIVRLRPNTPTDLLVRFERPQDVMLYCTVYCGLGHDQMHAQVVVT